MTVYTTKTLNNFDPASALADANNVAVEQGDGISRRTTLGAIKAFFQTAFDALFVQKSGDTMTGPLDIEIPGGGSNRLLVAGEGTTQLILRRAQGVGASAALNLQKSRGTLSSPTAVATNDRLFVLIGAAYDGSGFREANYIFCDVVAATPGPTDMESQWQFQATPAASGSPTEIMRLRHSTGLSMFGANTVVSPNRLFRNRAFTVATLPAASIAAGDQAIVTDANAPAIGAVVAGGGAVRCLVNYDGTNWRVA